MDSATIVGLVIIALIVLIALAYYVWLRREVIAPARSIPNDGVLMNEPLRWSFAKTPEPNYELKPRRSYRKRTPDDEVYGSIFGSEH